MFSLKKGDELGFQGLSGENGAEKNETAPSCLLDNLSSDMDFMTAELVKRVRNDMCLQALNVIGLRGLLWSKHDESTKK